MMLTTRRLPSDPAYLMAINLIEVEFNDCDDVMKARREYLELVSQEVSEGAVRLTLTSLPSWLPRAVADWDDEATFFQTPPFPTGCDPARGLAVFSVQPQPS